MKCYNCNKNQTKIIQGGKYKKINTIKLNNDNVYKYKLDNDINLVEIPIDTNIFSCGVYVNIGSNDENDKKLYGIAHVLEHMMFKGTKTKSAKDIDLLVDNLGADINAMTSYTYTGYYCSGNPNDDIKLLDLILDIFLNSIFSNEDFINEKKVVLEELKMTIDNNDRKLIDCIYNNCLNESTKIKYHPIIGYKDTINNIQINDLKKFKKKYTNKKTYILISGLYNKTKIFNLIKNIFNCNINKVILKNNIIKNISINKKNFFNDTKTYIVNIKTNIEQSQIKLCYKINNQKNNKYDTIINLISNILTIGFTSKIFDLLRNKLGVSYYCNSYIINTYSNDIDLYIIELGLDNKNLINTIKEILLLLKYFCIHNITEDELNIVKKKNENKILHCFKYPIDYIFHYGNLEMNKFQYIDLIDIYKDNCSITLKDINTVCRKLFLKKNLIFGIIGKINKDLLKKIENLILDDNLYYK